MAAAALDPIEKKPLYNFHKGSKIFSIGTFGCNFHCKFCQNYEIAKEQPPFSKVTSQEIVDKALELKDLGNIGIAYTYNEPIIWYEFVLETAKLAKENQLKNIMVTNGYINEKPLKELLPYIDALNIDLKTYNNNAYKEVCGGDLDSIKSTVELCVKMGCHVEITTLMVPKVSDDIDQVVKIANGLVVLTKILHYIYQDFFQGIK
jgi:pyruvate formate lyase activating enzyme